MPKLTKSHSNSKTFYTLDVRSDDADVRDYIFQPSLTLLPEKFDNRGRSTVLDQKAEGACVGFALAVVINVSLKRRLEKQGKKTRKMTNVSTRMLYEIGKRYDEWEGEHYDGTSIRGVIKGWYKHGVTTEKLWPYLDKKGAVIKDFAFTRERAEDALKRPLGAYYRVNDKDVSLIQAAVVEGDAVIASAWIHSGWLHDNLLPLGKKRLPTDNLGLKKIPAKTGKKGLHAFAIVGYTPNGLIIQNSWGNKWGKNGCALLGYNDWLENRQDAWVARPGPETRDSNSRPRIFTTSGVSGVFDNIQAGTTISRLNLDPQLHNFLINTGDKGKLSSNGRIITKKEDLPNMAQQIQTLPIRNGFRHIILYAHGGAFSEAGAAKAANRIFLKCKARGLGAYFFIWESGFMECFLGRLESTATTELAGDSILQGTYKWFKNLKKTAKELFEKASGEALSYILMPLWKEMMDERAPGASKRTGGASLFSKELFKEISRTQMQGNRYKIHLVGHSAGSIFLGFLYQNVLRDLLSTHDGRVSLGTIQFMVPAITIDKAREQFSDAFNENDKNRFKVYTLSTDDEENEIKGIFPHSILTYVSEHLAGSAPLLGIKQHFKDNNASRFANLLKPTKSKEHMEFNDDGHEIENILDDIEKFANAGGN